MSQHDRDYSEKRDFIRMSINAKVTLRVNGLALEGVCVDLSSNGMQIEAQSDLNVGNTLDVHLPSPTANLDPYDVTAEVVRVDNLPEGRQILGLKTNLPEKQ